MAQMGRPGLSAPQKSEVWRRWKSGQSHSDIGRALGKHPASIHGIIAANGGIVPMPRRRSRWALGWEERWPEPPDLFRLDHKQAELHRGGLPRSGHPVKLVIANSGKVGEFAAGD